MKANYYLNSEANGSNEHLIIFFFSYEGNRLKYSTSQTIGKDFWLPKEQRAKSKLKGYQELNNFLDSFEAQAKKIYRDALTNGTAPTPSYIRQQLDNFLNKAVLQVKERTFESFFKEFIEDKRNKVSFRTIQKFDTPVPKLNKVSSESGIRLSFDNMNSAFYNAFLNYEIAKGKSNETTSKEISLLKTFLHWATMMEYNKSLKFIRMFKTFEKEKDVFALTNEELFMIYNYDFSYNETKDKIRDLFCFACFTSLRYSDVMNLKPANIKQDCIAITTIKTSDPIYIALNPFSKAILEKYNNQLPHYANAFINRELKEIAEKAEVKDEVIRTKFVGTKRIDEVKKKCELITFHVARKTFVTLSLQRGMRQEVVMKQTGHKDFKTMKKYVAVANQMIKEEMNSAWSGQAVPVPGKLRKVS